MATPVDEELEKMKAVEEAVEGEKEEEQEGEEEEDDDEEEEVDDDDEEAEGRADEKEEVDDDDDDDNDDDEEEAEGRADEKEEEVNEDDDDDNDDDEEEAEGRADEKEEEAEKATPQPVNQTEKKQDEVLNLNNEVVKMRKEVKRVRALIIRKLTRQITVLKKKKGKEMEVERNQRRAARLLEEIHAMKVLAPDLVTKTALQKSLNFEQVCKNPKSTISDRAVARIATHPQVNKKIELIKAAVKAFKMERMKGGRQRGKVQAQNQAEKSKLLSKGSDGKRGQTKEEKDMDTEDASIDKPSLKDKVNTNPSADNVDVQEKRTPETKSIKPASIENSEAKETAKNKPQSRAAETKPSLKPAPEVIQKKEVEAESDLESSDDEEKEYFDDSTEERFHKQSSESESDDNDFFVGKVSKFKKKKKKTSGELEKQTQEVKGDTTGPLKTSETIQSELDELESRLTSKRTSLKSVFCSSLSGTKQSRGGGGGGAGRGGNTFSKQKGGSDGNRGFSKQSKFQQRDKGKEGSKYSKSSPEDRHPEEKGLASPGRGRGRGRGRGDFMRQKDHRGGGVFSHQAPQQVLHPSWEASKKRKEQQGQILAFQGKKIKFDDDD